MWICAQCNARNEDHETACAACGAVRAAGRFSPQRPARSAENRRPQVSRPSPSKSNYTLPDTDMPRQPRRPLVLARVSGTLLSILLPVFTLLLSWRQRDALRQALLPLLLPAGAPAWLEWICYGILTLTAVLLALLPGLWTLLLARRPLPPASSKKP